MNIKKLFPEKKLTKKGLLEFLDKKGFYIVLVLCIAIVGATAVFVMTHNINTPNLGLDNAGNIIADEASKVTNPLGDQSSTKTGTSAVNTTPTPKPQPTTAPATKAPAKKGNTIKTQNFILPVFGNLTLKYAKNELVYSSTLDEWRTHEGVDLASDIGTAVKAVAAGVVTEVKADPMFGTTVIISHSNGIETVYSNLASEAAVVPNQKVAQGETIGSVGSTATFESAEKSHLHFEVLKNGVTVNPASYLPSPESKK